MNKVKRQARESLEKKFKDISPNHWDDKTGVALDSYQTCPGEEIIKIWDGECRAKVQIWTDKENSLMFILRRDKDAEDCKENGFYTENCFYALEGEVVNGRPFIKEEGSQPS